ncbi:hypothetical protein CRM22_009443 [Opisthorchis felineus]|uniref:5'-nucleotidase n=1 Tax=Opisthorchis felineus TaxID=147828 RepID=A0A4S2LEK6_OPIFE|nr:hypothetical protein CRM22_009443 [Opisthorchis felineus]
MIKCTTSLAAVASSSSLSATSAHMQCRSIVDSLFRSVLTNSKDFASATVHIKDIESTRKKFDTFVSSGSGALQVVSDFDRTISKYKHNGVITPTCHGIFEMDPELTESTKSRLTYLRDKYYPVEIDPTLSDAEKIPHMVEWWRLSHESIVSCGLHRDALAKTVRECGLVLRDGVHEFAELLRFHQIPLLIFSAGLGDVIELLLENFSMYTENVRVVSNFMQFNDEDPNRPPSSTVFVVVNGPRESLTDRTNSRSHKKKFRRSVFR